MESFSSLKTEHIGKKVYRTRDDARADVFDYIERFYNTVRRHSTIGYVSPVEFEEGGISLTACPRDQQQATAPPLRTKPRLLTGVHEGRSSPSYRPAARTIPTTTHRRLVRQTL